MQNDFMNDNYSYPDLRSAIDELSLRFDEVNDEHKPLLEKWAKQLATIHKEMRHLERIESYSTALKNVATDPDETMEFGN